VESYNNASGDTTTDEAVDLVQTTHQTYNKNFVQNITKESVQTVPNSQNKSIDTVDPAAAPHTLAISISQAAEKKKQRQQCPIHKTNRLTQLSNKTQRDDCQRLTHLSNNYL
jgi:hypothetical protein